MQNTGLANYSSFPVWKKVSPMDMIRIGCSQQPFCCVLGQHWHGDTHPNEQSGDLIASQLFTSENIQVLSLEKLIFFYYICLEKQQILSLPPQLHKLTTKFGEIHAVFIKNM